MTAASDPPRSCRRGRHDPAPRTSGPAPLRLPVDDWPDRRGLRPPAARTPRRLRRRRLDRPGRQRALGGGDDFDLGVDDQFLLTIVWLRHYSTQECLGYLFGVSDSTALRAVRRCLPLLEQSGRDSMRLPDPGKGRRRDLPALLKQTPDLVVIV